MRGLNLVESYSDSNKLDLHLTRDINVFIGKNGTGKSTVVDAIHAVKDVQKLAHLKRENTHDHHSSELTLRFDDACINFKFFPIPRGNNFKDDWLNGQYLKIRIDKDDNSVITYENDIDKYILSTHLQSQIEYCLFDWSKWIHYFEPEDELNLNLGLCADELCKLNKDLSGLIPSDEELAWKNFPGLEDLDINRFTPQTFSKPVSFSIEKEIVIADLWFADDPVQSSRVPFALLPSGWKAYMQILNWLQTCPLGSICLLEEPEVHMHHTLQRHLAKRLREISHQHHLQLFITTHSPIFMSMPSSDGVAVQLFQFASNRNLRVLKTPNSVLDDLGILASDVLLPNGVIWVEGESDRIYIKHWIKQYCLSLGLPLPDEHTHFEFSLYGGANLSHYGAGANASDELIDVFKLNRNAFVVMDSDLDFLADEGKSTSSAKQRFIDGLENDSIWITNGYTIENYLPEDFSKKYFRETSTGRFVVKKQVKKVTIAQRYITAYPSIEWGNPSNASLKAAISSLVCSIQKWNSQVIY